MELVDPEQGIENKASRPTHTCINIPADWALIVCREKAFNEAKLFIWLKMRYGGKFELTSNVRLEICRALNTHKRTNKRLLKELISKNWLGYNQKTKMVYPRGFETIRKMEDIPSRKAYSFHFSEFSSFKEFILAAAISVYIGRKRYKIWLKNRGEGGFTKEGKHFKSFAPVLTAISNKALAGHFNISVSTASIWKSKAVHIGYMIRHRSFEQLSPDLPANFKTLSDLQKAFPELKGRVKISRGAILVQESDQMCSLLKPKRRTNFNCFRTCRF